MERPRFSQHHAVFPSGYTVPRWLIPAFWLIAQSRPLRALFVEVMPRTRLRLAIEGRWFHWMGEQLNAGRVEQILNPMDEDATWETFGGLEVYRGRDGFVKAWEELRESFPGEIEVSEFIDLLRSESQVIVVIGTRTSGSQSGLSLEDLGMLCLNIRIVRGMGVGYRAYQGKSEALKAVGLSE